ncbi:hypothetical protein FGF1_23220 [Flavobacteriaceae bacterium GF1]
MIKLFRSIRFNVLENNRIGTYLKYAVGEIVLVVIGILLALQINNWSEARKRKVEEKELLNALIEDFSQNKLRIEHTIDKETDVVKMSTSLIKAMQSNRTDIPLDSIRFWVASGAKSWWKTEFVTGTYDAMISSGKIEILESDDLKRVLSQFSADIDSGFEDHYESMNYLIAMNKISADITPALIHDSQSKELGVVVTNDDFDVSVKKLLENDTYLGLLISKTWLETLRIDYQQKLKAYINEIISICRSESAK